MSMSISHTKSVPVTSSETSLPLSTSPHKPLPSTLSHKPPSSTSPQKPPPSTSPLKLRPSTSPHKPRPSTSPQKPPPSTSPLNLRPSASSHKPRPSTSSQKPRPSTSPEKPPPSASPQKPPPLTSPQKPPPPTSPHKPPPSTPFQKPPPSISPHKLCPSTSIHKQPPSISSPKLPSSLSSQQSINLKSYIRGASFITYFYFILFILLYASPIFLNIVINLKLNTFINNSIFLKFLYTIFRLEFFDIFFNRIFIFLLEYYDSYIAFTYRKYLRTLDKNDNSTLLKQVWIVLLTTFIFWVFFVIIDKCFSKSTRYFKPSKPCKTKNKNNHVFIILKRFLFCLLLILFSYKINGIKTNFEVLERQDSREVFDKDSYFAMQDIVKNETKKILSYYALSKIVLRKHKFYFRYILLLSGDISLNPGPFADTFPFPNSSFSDSESRIHLGSNDENLDTEKWTNFKKKGLHLSNVNINSLLPKIDEIRHMTKITNAAIVGTGETKLDESILSSEIDIEGYDLLRLDRSRRGGGVACYVKKSLAYNYRDNFCKNTESIFIDIFLPKTKPILIGILYRPPDKNDFVKNLEETFTNCNILDKQECYLLGDFNINIFQNGENVFEKKLSNSKLNSIPFIVKEYLDFDFSYSLKQLISTPTRTTENTATLIDHILTNSPHKIIKSGVVEVNLSDHELIYCTRKTTKLKSNKHNELNIRSMKNYTGEGFVELLKKIDFPNY